MFLRTLCRRLRDYIIPHLLVSNCSWDRILFDARGGGQCAASRDLFVDLIAGRWKDPEVIPTRVRIAWEAVERRLIYLALLQSIALELSDVRPCVCEIIARACRPYLGSLYWDDALSEFLDECDKSCADVALFSRRESSSAHALSVAPKDRVVRNDPDEEQQAVMHMYDQSTFRPIIEAVERIDLSAFGTEYPPLIDSEALSLAVATGNVPLISSLIATGVSVGLIRRVFPSSPCVSILQGDSAILDILLFALSSEVSSQVNAPLLEIYSRIAAESGHDETHRHLVQDVASQSIDITKPLKHGLLGIKEAAGSACLSIIQRLIPHLSLETEKVASDRGGWMDEVTHKTMVLTNCLCEATRARAHHFLSSNILFRVAR